MPTALPTTHREVRLAAVPHGLPRPEDFAVVEAPLPLPGPGEVLVRNRLFHVAGTLRMLIAGATEGTLSRSCAPVTRWSVRRSARW